MTILHELHGPQICEVASYDYFYGMTWEIALKDYQNWLRLERGLSENSIASYLSDLLVLTRYLEEEKIGEGPEAITALVLQDYVYKKAKTLKPRSQARLVSSLKSFFGFLQFEKYRKDDPTALLESPRLGRKLPDTLNLEEINRMAKVLIQRREVLERGNGTAEEAYMLTLRNEAILETLYSCGLRVSELINLKLSDLYFEEGFIQVTGKGNKQRLVPVTGVAVERINTYIAEGRSLTDVKAGHGNILFLNRRGRQLTRAMVFTMIRRVAEEAGVEKTISPHTFRHSFATHLLQHGADLRAIQQMLGHESITTTEVYMHLDRSDLKKSILAYHPRKQ